MLSDPQNSNLQTDTLISRHLFHYRSSIHATTGETPFKLMCGREMRTHFDKLKPSFMLKIQQKLDEKIQIENIRLKYKEFTDACGYVHSN